MLPTGSTFSEATVDDETMAIGISGVEVIGPIEDVDVF